MKQRFFFSLLVMVCFCSISATLFSDSIRGSYYYYTIKPGNKLSQLLKIFNISKKSVDISENKVSLRKWQAGRTLKIPMNKIHITAYQVQNRDSLFSIARKFSLSWTSVKTIIDPKIQEKLLVGTTLYLPGTQNQNLSQLKPSTNNNDRKILPVAINTTQNPSTHSISDPPLSSYIIQKKDTYYSLALKFQTTVSELQAFNENKPLLVGMTLRVPDIDKDSHDQDSNPSRDPVKNTETKSSKNVTVSQPKTPMIYQGPLAAPYPGKGVSYSSLLPGATYTTSLKNGKIVGSPIPGTVSFKPLAGFGNSIFITSGNRTVILASKGFTNYQVKKGDEVKKHQAIAYVKPSYKLYLFLIRDGNVSPPF